MLVIVLDYIIVITLKCSVLKTHTGWLICVISLIFTIVIYCMKLGILVLTLMPIMNLLNVLRLRKIVFRHFTVNYI